ncbi:hypothetical protein C8F04DRAFT_1329952 [Mycena alexandri]|uniref:Uncharacterized protein n=1 Tax=Mycena alexandri TaxID=1745969 RepID=A0AAD6T1L2_9AGAR|nr:hypothetical protein C8F04DRAFT_1329952 [Mycena alexandri]
MTRSSSPNPPLPAIQDIVIFSHLDFEPRRYRVGEPTNLWNSPSWLAPTEAFHAPALNCWWRSTTLRRPIQCLLCDLCVVRFLRPTQPEDLERIRVYALRVRKLYGFSQHNLSAIFPPLDLDLLEDLPCNLQSLVSGGMNSQSLQLLIIPWLTELEVYSPLVSCRRPPSLAVQNTSSVGGLHSCSPAANALDVRSVQSALFHGLLAFGRNTVFLALPVLRFGAGRDDFVEVLVPTYYLMATTSPGSFDSDNETTPSDLAHDYEARARTARYCGHRIVSIEDMTDRLAPKELEQQDMAWIDCHLTHGREIPPDS